MKTYDEAKITLQTQAVISGGVYEIEGKILTSKNGYFYLDGTKVIDPFKEVYSKVVVDEKAIYEEMKR